MKTLFAVIPSAALSLSKGEVEKTGAMGWRGLLVRSRGAGFVDCASRRSE